MCFESQVKPRNTKYKAKIVLKFLEQRENYNRLIYPYFLEGAGKASFLM